MNLSSSIRSSPVTVPVLETSPGIFTADESGSGPGSIFNSSAAPGANMASNPTPKGSTITFYATGAGPWNAPYPDGGIVLVNRLPIGGQFLAPVAPLSVTIGGQAARVVQAAAQPYQVYGMLQVTAEVPDGIGSGAQPIFLKIGANENSKQNVTVWVR